MKVLREGQCINHAQYGIGVAVASNEAKTTIDPKTRQALYSKALAIWMDDAPAIPLYQQMDLYGVSKKVKFQALSSEQLVGPWICLADQKC